MMRTYHAELKVGFSAVDHLGAEALGYMRDAYPTRAACQSALAAAREAVNHPRAREPWIVVRAKRA